MVGAGLERSRSRPGVGYRRANSLFRIGLYAWRHRELIAPNQ